MENKKFKISVVSPIINVIDTSKVEGQGEGSKSSKLSSVLDACIKTNFSDESFDFIECDFGKNRNIQSQKKENFICEICKTDITDLSVDSRAFHVNKCIDKQISSQSEAPPPIQDENVTMLGCPFCSKQFSVPELQSNHIKKCGKTKGLSTQNIIQALELERRYALERMALGIPPAKPHKPLKSQKNAVTKKILVEPKSKTQSDLQLAKALSLSLTKEVELKPPASHQRPGRKNKIGITPLLVLRNDEERRKLLLEKVATIVEPEDICSENPEKAQEHSEDCCEVSELWNLSSQSSEKCRYYVERLLSWIRPSEMEAGAKLCHFSQIAGHEILTQVPCDYTFSCPTDQDGRGTSEIQSADASTSSGSVTKCLRSLVASPWMSDVDIRTSCGTVLPAHRLILALRCPPLKQDPDFCFGAERSVLRWESVSFEAALQFLNFVYTGKIHVERGILRDLLFLAKKYEVGDLLPVLQSFQCRDKEDQCKGVNMEEQTSTLWCGQKETSAVTFDSDAEDCEDLQIVCEFLSTDLKPSSQFDSQQSSTPLNTPGKDFNVCRSGTESPKESRLSTKETGFCAQDKGTENLADAIRYPGKLADMQNTEDIQNTAFNKVFDPNQVLCYPPHQKPENEGEEFNIEKGESLKWSDPNSGNLNQIKESKSKQDDILDTKNEDSFKLLSPCSVSFMNSNPILETTPKEIDVDNRHKVVSDTLLDSSGLSSGILLRDPNAKFESFNVCCTENIVCDNVLYPLSSNLHLFPKTHSNSPARSFEIGCTDKKSVPEICELSDNLSLRVTSRGLNPELTADCAALRVPVSSDRKFVSVKDVPSSPLRFLESSDGNFFPLKDVPSSPLRLPESSDGTFVSVKDVPSSPLRVPESSDGIFFSVKDVPSSPLRFPESSDRTFVSVKEVKSPPVIFDVIDDSTSDSDKSENLGLVGHSNSSNGVIGERDSDRVLGVNRESLNDFYQNLETVQDESNSSLEAPEEGFFSEPLPTHSECKNVEILSDSENSDGILGRNNSRKNLLCDILGGNNSRKDLSGDILGGNNSRKDLSGDILRGKNDSDCKNIQSLEDSDQTGDKITVVKCGNRRLGVNSDSSNTKFQFSDSPITPLPDYKKMMTPEIKQALRNIGVKALPRRKAIALLSHVYDETHPLVNPETNLSQRSPPQKEASPRKKKKESTKRKLLNARPPPPTKKQKENNPSQEDSEEDSSSENPDWSGCVPEISFSQYNNKDSPTKISKDDLEAVKQYIRSNQDVYSHILNYKPLNMLNFHHELKDSGIKISVQKLMDFLDEQCITFTCPRKEEFRKKQTARTQRFRKNMIAKLSQQH